MQAIVQDNYGSGETLTLREIERPSIGEHGVLVRVRAAGVNPADWAVMSGLPYIARPVTLGTPSGRTGLVPTHLNRFTESVTTVSFTATSPDCRGPW